SAFVLAGTLRRNSRVSTSSYDQVTHLLGGQDGLNLFPFKNGIRASSSQDSFWARNRIEGKRSCLHKFTTYLQTFYEKSRLHYLLPIIILVAVLIIENPEERAVLLRKKEYIEREEQVILQEVYSIEQRLRAFYLFYNTTDLRNQEIRKYRNFAMNRLNKAVYWYVLQVYYLNDQESYKSSLLHPTNPEKLWKSHFGSSFGRIFALKNYTQQLSERCWEIGVEMNPSSLAYAKLKRSIEEFNAFTGLQHVLTPTWTFWNSMFLAVTTYSTIGRYGVRCDWHTLVLMILHKLGRFFLLCLEHFWNYLLWFMEFLSCLKDAEKLKGKVLADEREPSGMPVLLAIGYPLAGCSYALPSFSNSKRTGTTLKVSTSSFAH
uniref:Uncharacterized protein n=1 Tax=Ditylenchus dipsaci TaxID=166011 RepID=A0A915CUR0_9BILA